MKIKKPPQTKEELLKKLNNKFLFLDSSLTLMLNNSTEEEFIKDIIINGYNEVKSKLVTFLKYPPFST